MHKHKISSLLFLAMFFFARPVYALTLAEYIEQVKTQNLGYTATNEQAQAYELLKEKAKLVTAITLYGYSERSFVEQNQAIQIVRYNRSYATKNQIGFMQTADFGLSTNLYYSLNQITYKGLNTSTSTNPALASSNWQSIPTIELSLPLWQNRLGASTKALRDSTFYTNESGKLLAQSLSISELVESEKTYWALVYAKKALRVQQKALESAKQILNYVSRRERMNLGEKGDVLQARALVETKQLLVKQAINDELIASRNFNKQRFIISDIVDEKLEDFDLPKLQNILVPQVIAGDRYDIKASEASMKAAVAQAKVEEENNKPSLNLYGAYSLNQIQGSKQAAISSSFEPMGRSGKVGVNFSMPINFGLTSDIRQGAIKSASAAKIDYRQKVFEQENDWMNLVQNMASYKENLKLSLTIEQAQKSKLENERNLLKQGRTSTYQILLFEQDYSNSELTTIQIAYKLLELLADEKLYKGLPL